MPVRLVLRLHTSSLKRLQWRDIVYWLVVALVLALYGWNHQIAGLTFPVPWPDEAVFVQQASSFGEGNTLFTPQLHDSRHVLWMPPGYMVTLGLVFKLFGSALEVARTLSMLTALLSFVVLAVFFRQERFRELFLVVCGFVVLSKHFILAGNIARMESLLILGILLGMLQFQKRHPVRALAILLVLPLIHPNGLTFLAAGCTLALIGGWTAGYSFRLGYIEKIFLSAVGILVAACAAYIVIHWSEFMHDLSFQLLRKSKRGLYGSWVNYGALLGAVIAAILVAVASYKKQHNVMILALFALAFGIVNRVGQEMWYEVFDVLAALFLLLVVVLLLSMRGNVIQVALCLGAGVYGLYSLDMIENPVGYPRSMKWYTMRPEGEIPYASPEDTEQIRAVLQRHGTSDRLLRTSFFPSGDELLFHDLQGKSITIVHAVPETTIFVDRPRDLSLIHISRYHPLGWNGSFFPWAFEESGIDTANRETLLLRRDSTEMWFYRFEGDTTKRP